MEAIEAAVCAQTILLTLRELQDIPEQIPAGFESVQGVNRRFSHQESVADYTPGLSVTKEASCPRPELNPICVERKGSL